MLAYLFAAALVDQWLIVGGLGTWGRVLLWLVLVGAAGTYFARRLLPPLLHRINPVFAAATIEKSQPTLKNSLINFLLLRGRRQEVAAPVYRAMESRAAVDLAQVRVEMAVDRTRLVRLGWVLATIVTLLCVYLIASPKNPLRSAARVLLPWSAIDAPTRVTIHDVRPGDAQAFPGSSVVVTAEVAGLREGEPLSLVYSTADGQLVDQTIPMTPAEGGLQYQCHFPPEQLGFQQDCEYYLAGGDCLSPRYHIGVQTAPTIVIDSVTYHYPSYAGLADRTVKQQGDLRAIEGTEITIHATANTEIKPGSAEIDLGCTGRLGLPMTIDGRHRHRPFHACGRWPTTLRGPRTTAISFASKMPTARRIPRPIRYRIDVIRDPAAPRGSAGTDSGRGSGGREREVGRQGASQDPDFGLRRVSSAGGA